MEKITSFIEPEFKKNSICRCPVCSSNNTNFLIKKYDDRFGQPDMFDFFYCVNCNIAFIKDKISKEKLPDLYGKYYTSSSQPTKKITLIIKILGSNLRRILNKLAGNLILIENMENETKVLEIGSGFNENIKKIIARNKLDWKGLEVNSACIDEITKAGLFAYRGTIDDNNINEKFDAVVLSQALEHQYNIGVFFKNCRKILNTGGKIIFTTPNFDSKYRLEYKENWIGWHAPYHTILLSKKGIENLCEKFGFKIEKFFTYTPTSWYFLQRNFKLPKRGQKNETFNFNFSLLKQFFVSIFLRAYEFFDKKTGDCIYCELKIMNK